MSKFIISDDNMFYSMLYDIVYDGINIEKKFKSFIERVSLIDRKEYLGISSQELVIKYIYPFMCGLVYRCLSKDDFAKHMKRLTKVDFGEHLDKDLGKPFSHSVTKELLGDSNLSCLTLGHPFCVSDFYPDNPKVSLCDKDFVIRSLIKAAAVYYFIHAGKHTVDCNGIFHEKESRFLDIMDNYKNLIMENIDLLAWIDLDYKIFPGYFYENIYMAVLYLYKEVYKRKLFPFKVISSMAGSPKLIPSHYSKNRFKNGEINQSLDLISYIEKSLISE